MAHLLLGVLVLALSLWAVNSYVADAGLKKLFSAVIVVLFILLLLRAYGILGGPAFWALTAHGGELGNA